MVREEGGQLTCDLGLSGETILAEVESACRVVVSWQSVFGGRLMACFGVGRRGFRSHGSSLVVPVVCRRMGGWKRSFAGASALSF